MVLSNTLNAINNINNKVNKIFHNPNINFFIIMNIILLISCYTFINSPLKNIISSFLSNPIIILFTLIIIIIIGYNNINIAILLLLLLFVGIFGSSIFIKKNQKYQNNNKNNNIEGFTTNESEDEDEDEDEDEGLKLKKTMSELKINSEKKLKEDKIKSREESIKSLKNVLLGGVKQMTIDSENEYQKSLNENKQLLFEHEKKNNKNNSNSNSNKINNKSNKKKEEFKTIDTRSFDPSKEEDTNLLITKEVLQDMLNRIDYKFESTKYLKKYLKHRIEEIVELNKLLEDEED